jgi:hypothetical protein
VAAATAAGGGWRTVGVAFGLGLLGILTWSLSTKAFGRRTEPAGSALADWLEIDALPFGLEPDVALWRGGELLVTWVDRQAPAEAPRIEPPEPEPGSQEAQAGDGRDGAPQEFDWSAVPVGPQGTPPVELLAVRYPAGSDERVEALFEPPPSMGMGDGEMGGMLAHFGPEGGRVAMDRGRLRWGDWEVAFVHERELEQGGTFRDVIRANLSLRDRPLVVYARWPRGLPASEERMVELLAALRPTPLPPDGG